MKKKKTTKETEVARNVQLLTSRPKGMSYEDYREARKYQNQWLKQRLKGFICYIASELVTVDKITGASRLFNHRQDDINKALMRKNPTPFVGSARYDLKPL